MYRTEHKGINEVYHEVASLFDDHPDLLDEFIRFFLDTSASASAHQASLGRHAYDRSLSGVPLRVGLTDKQRGRRYRINGPHTERDTSVECPDLDDKSMMKLHKEQRKKDRKNSDDPDIERDRGHRDIKRKSARKVEDFGVQSGSTPSEIKMSEVCTVRNLFFVRMLIVE